VTSVCTHTVWANGGFEPRAPREPRPEARRRCPSDAGQTLPPWRAARRPQANGASGSAGHYGRWARRSPRQSVTWTEPPRQAHALARWTLRSSGPSQAWRRCGNRGRGRSRSRTRRTDPRSAPAPGPPLPPPSVGADRPAAAARGARCTLPKLSGQPARRRPVVRAWQTGGRTVHAPLRPQRAPDDIEGCVEIPARRDRAAPHQPQPGRERG